MSKFIFILLYGADALHYKYCTKDHSSILSEVFSNFKLRSFNSYGNGAIDSFNYFLSFE